LSKTSPVSRTKSRLVGDPWRQQREEARFTLILGALSIAFLLFYYAKQELLLYGDAVAHINIARRVVDNRHPLESYGQLGTVWLPLQHVAMLPFVWIEALWRSGIAGSIPSMAAYVLGTLGILRLVSARASKFVAYVAAAIYALNPNLLYMQTTAMNEPIFLAFFIWTLVYLDEFLRATSPQTIDPHVMPAGMKPERALEACGITLAGGAYTRYDGWFVALIVLVVILLIVAGWWRRERNRAQRRSMTKSLIEVLVLNALVPVYWFIYTYCVSGYGFDFLNGPYSAKAIALRGTIHGAPPYPGQHHLFTAALYFLKAAKLNVGADFFGQALFAMALAGTVVAGWNFRRYGVFLLLWLPVPFYALSIAYGSVPIYLPVWYPFSYYNVRYGLELLPVFAVFPVILTASRAERLNGKATQTALWVVLVAIVVTSSASAYHETPITLREAEVNSRGRTAMERALANALEGLPGSAMLLMYGAEHPGALQQAGIRWRRVISEGEHPDWDWALLDPARHADYMVACVGDPVWTAIRPQRTELTELLSVSVPGQSRCTIYKGGRQ
jgi:4-amino-4-deoxy-L-arabinose transferase-like glycosyltransferase